MARVGVKIPQDGNRTNTHRHVVVVHEHVWRTLCSVCATGARVVQPFFRIGSLNYRLTALHHDRRSCARYSYHTGTTHTQLKLELNYSTVTTPKQLYHSIYHNPFQTLPQHLTGLIFD
jgi:hypothetical protein